MSEVKDEWIDAMQRIAADARREALEEAATMLSEIAVVKQGSESPPSMFIGDGYEMAAEDVRDLIDKPKERL